MGEGQQSLGKSVEVATLQRDPSSLGTASKIQWQDWAQSFRQAWKTAVYMPISSTFPGAVHLPHNSTCGPRARQNERRRNWTLPTWAHQSRTTALEGSQLSGGAVLANSELENTPADICCCQNEGLVLREHHSHASERCLSSSLLELLISGKQVHSCSWPPPHPFLPRYHTFLSQVKNLTDIVRKNWFYSLRLLRNWATRRLSNISWDS